MQAEHPEIFCTCEWALAVQRAYGESLLPWILCVEDENKSLRGLAALATDASGRQVSFLCATTGDYCDFLSPSGEGDAIVDAVLQECKTANATITLANVPADSASIPFIRQAAHRYGYYLHQRPAYECARISLGSEQQREEVRGTLRRKKMRRLVSRMEQEHAARVDHLGSWDEVNEALPQFARAHVARFLATGRISNLVRPERRKFLEGLAQLLSRAGWLTVSRMTADGKPVAWNYGFRFRGSWFWYQPTFDTNLEPFSPGIYLLSQIVAQACDDPEMEVVDLGLGAEGYKERLANSSRSTVHLTLTRSLGSHWRGVLRYRCAQWLKAWPRGENVARRYLAILGSVRARSRQIGAAKTLISMARNALSVVFSRDEVYFFEGPPSASSEPTNLSLQAIDLNALADAAMKFSTDESTLAYLVRCAPRLRQGSWGFALKDSEGQPVHFAWMAAFDGFLRQKWRGNLHAADDALLLYDSWTPGPLRRRGFYTRSLESIARTTAAEGKSLWTLSRSANSAAIARARFQLRYSLVRTKVLWWQRISRREVTASKPAMSEVRTLV